MQKTITKYQKRFNRLIIDIENDKILKKRLGNPAAGMALLMIKSLKTYLKENRI